MNTAAHALAKAGPGRPRAFVLEDALNAAILVFREHGFSGASIHDLRSAMNLTVGSIYKAFGDKSDLFLAAFDRYTAMRVGELGRLLEAETCGVDRLRAIFDFYAKSSHGAEGRRGCLVISAAVHISAFDSKVATRVKASLQNVEATLLSIIHLGQSDGTISIDVDAVAAARTLLCLLQGMRVVGKLGRTEAQMAAIVDQALAMVACRA